MTSSLCLSHPASQDAVDGGALSLASLLQDTVSRLLHVEHEGVERLLHRLSAAEGERHAGHRQRERDRAIVVVAVVSGGGTFRSSIRSDCSTTLSSSEMYEIAPFRPKTPSNTH